MYLCFNVTHLFENRNQLDQAALEIGFSRAYYGGVERGVRNISSLNLVKIAKNFKVEVGDLFPEIDRF